MTSGTPGNPGGPGDWQTLGNRLAAESDTDADPSGWFEPLYRAGAEGHVALPWNREYPHPLLAQWVRERGVTGREGLGDGAGRRAVVTGSGLGADAAYLSTLGFDTLGFDVSDTAVAVARERFLGTGADYLRADLFDLPAEWRHAFDLVVEIFTVQAMPRSARPAATRSVAGLTAPGGTLLVVQAIDESASADGPPWPLTRAEVKAFAADGLDLVALDAVPTTDSPTAECWRAEFHRPARLAGNTSRSG